jgi:hypothetical protein
MLELHWIQIRDGAGGPELTAICDQHVSPAPVIFDEFSQSIDRIHIGQIDSPEREAISQCSIVFVLELAKAICGPRDCNDMCACDRELFCYEIADPLGSARDNRDLPREVQHGRSTS